MVGFIVISWLLIGLMAWQITHTVEQKRHQQQALRRIPVVARPQRRMMDE